MDILILGDGDQELSWARWVLEHREHRIIGAFPGFPRERFEEIEIPIPVDLDAALSLGGLDLVIVGGNPDFLMEALRRVASVGLPAICRHPPGVDSEAYYQVSMSREETGAVIVPDLPLRLHPAISRIKDALIEKETGGVRGLSLAIQAPRNDKDLARDVFPSVVDLVRAIAGEVEAVWAIGQPAGLFPGSQLSVFLDMAGGVQAQLNLKSAGPDPCRLTLQCDRGTLSFQYEPSLNGPSRFELNFSAGRTEAIDFESWDPHQAVFSVLIDSLGNRQVPTASLPSPNLNDGIRAMELTETVVRSLRRERKINLHYQSIGEDSNFKSFMTSTGCLILLGILFILPLALAGPALGMPGLIYISYLIPLMLGVFVLMQILRFAVRGPRAERAPGHLDLDKAGGSSDRAAN